MQRITIWLAILAIIGMSCGGRAQTSERAAALPEARGVIYLPIAGNPSPLATPDPAASCFHNPKALAFYRLLVSDGRQQRPRIDCYPVLVRAAERRAASLIASGLWSHCDPNGVCSNSVARALGCVLPPDYAANGNNIESLVAGSPDAELMFTALANSPSHSDHLFGRGWFQQQRHVGIAVGEGGKYGWYWVVLIGTCLENRDAMR